MPSIGGSSPTPISTNTSSLSGIASASKTGSSYAPKAPIKTGPRPVPKPIGGNSWNPPSVIQRTSATKPSGSMGIPTGSIGGNTATQPPAKEKPGPVASPLDQKAWVAKDPQYLQAIADLQKSLGDTTATTNAGISDYQNQLQNQLGDAETQRQQQLASMLNDYASRGMDTSTGYQDAQDQYNNQQNSMEDALRQAIAQRIAGLQSDLTGAKNNVTSGTNAAAAAAAARYQAMLASGLA